jgi:hypothetical protein
MGLLSRYHAIFCLPFSFHSFVRPAPLSILPPRPHISIAVARSGGQGRRFFSAAEGSSLTDASTAAAAGDRVVGRAPQRRSRRGQAMASGSQVSIMRAVSHRIARSLSASAQTSSATYRIGGASISIRRLCAAKEARSALRAAKKYRPPRFAHWRAPHGPCAGLP